MVEEVGHRVIETRQNYSTRHVHCWPFISAAAIDTFVYRLLLTASLLLAMIKVTD